MTAQRCCQTTADKANIDAGPQVEDDEYLLGLAPQTVLVLGPPADPAGAPDPSNVFDRLLSLLRWSGGVDTVYKEVRNI
jgi:hypothetical protein